MKKENTQSGLLGFEKVALAIARIKNYCVGKRVLVAFSGGKDSQCCYHLCKEAGVDFEAQFTVCRFEPPEQINFVHSAYPDVVFRRNYKMTLVDEIAYRGLPSRWARWCCNNKHVKTEGFDITVLGVRAAESAKRRDSWRMFGQKPDRTYYLAPIIDWSEEDVWNYLNSRSIPHCSLYDEGFRRIGCVCCPLAVSRKKRDWERWPKIANVLFLGLKKHWARAVSMGGVSKSGREFSCLKFGTPEKCFNHWLLTGSTSPDYKPDMDALPCMFAGTGFSESDGVQVEGIEEVSK